jgi:hypothetical protein
LLDFASSFVYYECPVTDKAFTFEGGCTVIKVNQEELKQKIEKLKKASAEKAAKTAGKKSEPEARKALKKVKRAQRKLRTAKAYKTSGKKAVEAAPAEAKASA